MSHTLRAFAVASTQRAHVHCLACDTLTSFEHVGPVLLSHCPSDEADADRERAARLYPGKAIVIVEHAHDCGFLSAIVNRDVDAWVQVHKYPIVVRISDGAPS